MKNEILAFNIFCCLQIVPVRWTVSKECCMFLQGLLSKQHWICLACSFGIVILTIYSGKHRRELVALLGHRLQGKRKKRKQKKRHQRGYSLWCPIRGGSALFRLQVLEAPVAQKLDSTIHLINHYLKDKCQGNHCALQWIVIYPVHSVIHLLNSWGQEGRYGFFEVY